MGFRVYGPNRRKKKKSAKAKGLRGGGARGAEVGGMGWTCSLEKIIYDTIKGGIRYDRDKHNPMGVVGHGHINFYLSHLLEPHTVTMQW